MNPQGHFQGIEKGFMSQGEPESEPEELALVLSTLSLAPVPSQPAEAAPPVVALDLATFPAPLALGNLGEGISLQIERDSPFQITVSRIQRSTPILNLDPVRYYVVWRLPGYAGNWDLRGIHAGCGTLGYQALLGLNAGFGGIRFCRRESIASARQAFLTEAARHQVPRERVNFLFRWQ